MKKEHVLAELDQDIYRSEFIDGQISKIFLRKGIIKEVLEWLKNTIM